MPKRIPSYFYVDLLNFDVITMTLLKLYFIVFKRHNSCRRVNASDRWKHPGANRTREKNGHFLVRGATEMDYRGKFRCPIWIDEDALTTTREVS
jgi:hypothetical protein